MRACIVFVDTCKNKCFFVKIYDSNILRALEVHIDKPYIHGDVHRECMYVFTDVSVCMSSLTCVYVCLH